MSRVFYNNYRSKETLLALVIKSIISQNKQEKNWQCSVNHCSIISTKDLCNCYLYNAGFNCVRVCKFKENPWKSRFVGVKYS